MAGGDAAARGPAGGGAARAVNRSPKARGWCFTLNAPDEIVFPEGSPYGADGVPADDVFEGEPVILPTDAVQQEWLLQVVNLPLDFLDQDGLDRAGLWYQMERGKAGRCHWQGVVRFKNEKRLAGLKRHHRSVHWEVCRDLTAARKYCSKEDTWISDGDDRYRVQSGVIGKSGRGNRIDLEEVRLDIIAGKDEEYIADTHFETYLRYGPALEKYRALKVGRRNTVTGVTVYWGDPGCGKSFRAREEATADGAACYFVNPPNVHNGPVWWDGYRGQKHVVIDDFDGWMLMSNLKRLLDGYVIGSMSYRIFEGFAGSNQLFDRSFAYVGMS